MNILISAVISLALLVGALNVPASIFSVKSLFPNQIFGAFTEISATENLADFPTTYNANLNRTIEVGTTSVASITTLAGLTSASALATIGTITTGVWNGTAIPVNKGGTGTTSPSTYMVMLGNGSNGLTMASTTGTTGQFLTSNGAGAYPSWQTSAVDTAIDYNFTSSAFRVKNLHASSTVANPLILNGVSYSMPSANGNASSTLMNSGAGVLAWTDAPVRFLGINSNVNISTSNTATTSLYYVSVPANTIITTNKQMRITALGKQTTSDCDWGVQIGNFTSSSTVAYSRLHNARWGADVTMYPISATSQYWLGISFNPTNNNADAEIWQLATSTTWNLAGQMYIGFTALSVGGGDVCTLQGVKVEIDTY